MNRERYYTNKIDIWGLGYVCSRVLFYSSVPKHFNKRTRPDKAWHEAITALLSGYATKGPQEASFAELIRQMLAWDPGDRPTAAEALQHPCMQEPDDDPSSSSSES